VLNADPPGPRSVGHLDRPRGRSLALGRGSWSTGSNGRLGGSGRCGVHCWADLASACALGCLGRWGACGGGVARWVCSEWWGGPPPPVLPRVWTLSALPV